MKKIYIFHILLFLFVYNNSLNSKIELGSADDLLLNRIKKTEKDIEEATELNLQHKGLTTEELDKILDLADPDILVSLDISHNEIIKIPKSIGKLINLEKLDASNNNIIPFPMDLLDCKNLEQLNLSANKLIRVPKDIEKLKNLKLIDVSNNRIKKLPDSIKYLRKLKSLYIDSNLLFELPDNLPISLYYIKASDNRLEDLPDRIGECENLEFLEIRGNRLKSLPLSISNLTSLKFLDLRENDNKLPFLLPNSFENKKITIFGAYEFADDKKITQKSDRRKPRFPYSARKRRKRRRVSRAVKRERNREIFLKSFR